MNLIKPENLKPSSVIAIVSVAGNIEDSAALKKAREYFENRGFGVKIFAPQNSCGYLSGDDMKRLECLHAAFADSSVDAVIAARGGYGSLRIVKNVDRALIKNNPKIRLFGHNRSASYDVEKNGTDDVSRAHGVL